MGKTWLAYRIKGNSSEKYDGVIQAYSREEAEVSHYRRRWPPRSVN
jgi:hypothetical protein